MTGNAAKYDEIAEDADYLREQYREEKRPITDIADEYGVAYETMRNAFEEAGIEVRSPGGGSREPSLAEQIANGNELERLYEEEYRTPTQIAEVLDVSRDTIYRALDEASLKRRPQYKRIAEGEPLEELYHEEHQSTYALAERLGVDGETVRRSLKEADVRRRPEGWQIEAPTARGPWSETDLAYLAGLIDGEGHLGLYDDDKFRSGKDIAFKIKMDAEGIITELHEKFGGGTSLERREDPYADMWGWGVYRVADAWVILNAVEPYLRLKQDTALEILDHIEKHYGDFIHEIDT